VIGEFRFRNHPTPFKRDERASALPLKVHILKRSEAKRASVESSLVRVVATERRNGIEPSGRRSRMTAGDDAAVPVTVGRSDEVDEEEEETVKIITTRKRTDADADYNHVDGEEGTDKETERLMKSVKESAPTWFDPKAFEAKDFDEWKYVEEMTAFVSEETLEEQLREHEEALKEELGRIVNENYEEFASLGDDLRDFEEVQREVLPETASMRAEIEKKREEISLELERLEASVEEKETQARASASKCLAEECTHTVAKVERLLAELDVSDDSIGTSRAARGETGEALASVSIVAEDRDGLEMLEPAFEDEQGAATQVDEIHQSHASSDINERARLLDRVASEVNRLKFFQKQGKDVSAIRDLSDRMEYCELKLTSLAQNALIEGLEKESVNIISHCLHGCSAIGKFDVVENAIRSVLVCPAVEKVLESLNDEDFSQVLPKLGEAALESCARVLALTRQSENDLMSHDFLAGTVLAEVDSQLSKAFQNSYSPGIPKVFIRNYKAAMEFINRLEATIPTAPAVLHFRASKHLETYNKRWNLMVYFSLRFQEYAGDVDAELSKPGLETSLASDGLLLTATTQAWLVMTKCMSDEVFVEALADKFVRLYVQVLSRYKTWVNTGIEALALQKNTESNTEEGSGISLSGNSSSWGATAGGDELMLVRLDVENLCDKVGMQGVEMVRASVGKLGNDAADAAVVCVSEGVNELRSVVSTLDDLVVKVFVERCVEALKQLKGITATFRMTNKPMPARHSHFVPMILSPLQTFLDNERTRSLSKSSRQAIVTQVIEEVSETYAEMTTELVAAVKKTEASLNRLKDRQGKTSSAGAGDTDKICRQLYLDAKEYGVQLEKFGIVARESNAFSALWEAVRASAPEESP